jgi:competence protein ComEC
MKARHSKALRLLAFSLVFPGLIFAHSGGLDANGGHYNRKTGEYHYHGQRTAPAPSTSTIPDISDQEVKDQDPQTQTVFITRTGSKYHRSGCRYLRSSQIPISLKDAKARGYTPCEVCNPPY